MNFSAWVLTIAGVVFLTLSVDIILPDGATNKYIKSIFAVVTVLVIAAPLPSLVRSDFDISGVFGQSETVQIDGDYLLYIFDKKNAGFEKILKEELNAEGVTGVEFTFLPDKEEYGYSIGGVLVDMKNLVISGENPNVNAAEKIPELLFSVAGVSKSKVVLYV